MSAGSEPRSSSRAFVTSSVSFRVSAPGCLAMTRITAGCPLTAASPRFTCGASATRATCDSTTDRSADGFTTTASRSPMLWMRPIERTSSSLSPWLRYPPVALELLACTASSTSSSVTPKRSKSPGSTSTWNCLRPPPIVTTWATPGIVRSRCRTTQSARVRTSIGGVWSFSLHMPTCMTCPMIEAIGANCGRMPFGIRSSATAIFSVTICRST